MTPLDAVVLGSHIGIFDTAALRAEFSLRTNRLALLDIDMECIAIVRSLVRIGRVGPNNSMPFCSACVKVCSVT